ncbi:LPXTG-site transpeptidase (sortase) family protein [Motilibacter rhizosphaerae]|uniref:LPXTG-site transpeptidase (Sortase) family protein n=1 Tax=Motilibacter rhizosphaerae TaxID=598652 RepID=A0A4Q7NVJ5_9ACTN|nr:class E sortase [Motilibacter rhizosphaerae]RZS91195.1 LPXTG-site transpeptidase (sortase) family protein [Motilibacter rhizosphaerae]
MSSSLTDERPAVPAGAVTPSPRRRMPAGRRVLQLVPAKQPLDRGSTPYLLHSALLVIALLAGTLALEMVGVGALREARDQRTTYAQFRVQLAKGLAPIGQTDTVHKQLLPLGAPVAVMQIPTIGLRQVVLEGSSSTVLRSGPGHERDTALPGQYGPAVVYGRGLAYGAPFRRLHELKAGDTILVTTGQGPAKGQQPFTYVVQDLRRAGDPIPQLQPHTGRLTLVTTDGPWWAPSGVLRVDAQLQGTPVPRSAKVLEDVPDDEKPFGRDSSALTPLLLWSQALLLVAAGFAWLRLRWDGWHAWLAGVPVLAYVALSTAHEAARLLPNIL